jgi:uncharacterized protein YndB with AHSA1/START domain
VQPFGSWLTPDGFLEEDKIVATDRIEREIMIKAPRHRVWEVLTQADHISGWFGDSTEVDLRPGGRMVFTWDKHGSGSHHAVVERVEPPGFFSYRWARRAGDEPAAGNSTLVEFTLTAAGDGTRLQVVETGFARLDVTAAEQGQAVEENTAGWISELGELQEYAERLPA